jgi:hypothetical protein
MTIIFYLRPGTKKKEDARRAAKGESRNTNCHSRDPPSPLRTFGGLPHSPAEAFPAPATVETFDTRRRRVSAVAG